MAVIDISIESDDWARQCPDIESVIENSAQAALKAMDIEDEDTELSLVLSDDEFIQGLNKQWRGKDKPTNVLSFPQDEPQLLGDVILAFETIHREAEAQEKTFENHVSHLIVHGILHLLGHDHENDEEAEVMESLEIEILRALGVKNPYESGNFVS
ncbi:MAG: rRNA maturation RNase YbeY [Alphaproteobacteria bacterium]|nr:rRNA maturation RNase YbeY [Alphaproteobacteria bacterium]